MICTNLLPEIGTPPKYLQSQNIHFRFGNRGYVRGFCLVLPLFVLIIICVASCSVGHAAVLQEDGVPILLGPLGAGGVLHGSRPEITQRRSRRDVVNNQPLTGSTLEVTTTDAPSNASFKQRRNDKLLSLEEPDGSFTGSGDFLSQVTPPHWSPSDPWSTDPTRPPTTTSTEAQPATPNSTALPTTTSSSPTYPEEQISTDPTRPPSTNPTEARPATINSTTIPTTTPRSPTYPEREISLMQENTYVAISSTVSPILFSGRTTGIGNIFKDNDYMIQSDDPDARNSQFNNSKEPPWVTDIAKPYVFPALLLVSWLFTTVALILHILIPDLRANTGKIFMCYILSLWLKCITTPASLFLTLCAPAFEKEKQACITIAFVSYMLSMSYRFWLNIMCFDIWRKVSNLVRLEHVQPVKLLYYHLWGWGMPAMFGLFALLIREFGSAKIIKPGFMNDGGCWFDQDKAIHQFLYMNLPGGFLHIANIGFVLKTRLNCSLMQQTSIPEAEDSNNHSVGRIHATTNYINEFNLQFRILNFMIGLWILWSISLFIQYIADVWYFKVIPGFLISLQGLIIFCIFISNNHKRQLIQRKFPFLKFNNCCTNIESKSITRQQSTNISDASSDRRKKLSVMSITSLTSLFGNSSAATIGDIPEHASVQELSSVSSASYNNTSDGGSVHLNLSLNRAHSSPPKEDTLSLNGDTIYEVATSFDEERQKSSNGNTRKLFHVPGLSELTLDPSHLISTRSISCTYPLPNNVMDVNPATVPVSKTLDG